MGSTASPRKDTEVLIFSTCESALIWKKVFADDQVKMRSLIPYDCVLINSGHLDTEADMQTGRTSCENMMLPQAGNYRSWDKPGRGPSLVPSEGARAC